MNILKILSILLFLASCVPRNVPRSSLGTTLGGMAGQFLKAAAISTRSVVQMMKLANSQIEVTMFTAGSGTFEGWKADGITTCIGEVMIHLLKEKAVPAQIHEMLQEYENMIKLVVDIRRGLLAGGGEMHADCETVLLEDGSEQDDLWGANWYPSEQRIEFESLINIRPRLGNRNIVIQDEDLRRQVESVTIQLLGGIQ